MMMSWIDWAMIIVAIVAIRSVSSCPRSYMRGVSDFLAANRAAGRYLLTISSAMGNMGVITFVYQYQMYTESGFTGIWWGMMGIITGVIHHHVRLDLLPLPRNARADAGAIPGNALWQSLPHLRRYLNFHFRH